MAKSQSVGSLKVLLTLATAQFSRGIKTAQQQLAEFSKFALKSSAVVGGSLLAGGAAAAVFAKRAADSADELVKMSDSLGIASENMAGFKLAADLAGASIEGVERGIILFQKALSEAKTGSKQAKEAFAFLNLDPAKLAAMAPDEGFLAVVDALNQIGNQADRTRAAMELFGKSSRDVIKIVNSQSSSVRESIKLTQQLGTAFKREDVHRIEQMNDAWTEATEVMRAFWQRIAYEVAPAVTALLKQFVNWAAQNRIVERTAAAIVDTLQGGFQTIGNMITGLRIGFLQFLDSTLSGVLKFSKAIDEIRIGMNLFFEEPKIDMGPPYKTQREQFQSAEAFFNARQEELDNRKKANQFTKPFRQMDSITKLEKALQEIRAGIRQTLEEQDRLWLGDTWMDWFTAVENAASRAGAAVRDFFKNRASGTSFDEDFGTGQKKKPFEIGFMRLDPVNFGLLKTDALFGPQRGETIENEQLMTLKQILDATRGVSRDVRGLTVPG